LFLIYFNKNIMKLIAILGVFIAFAMFSKADAQRPVQKRSNYGASPTQDTTTAKKGKTNTNAVPSNYGASDNAGNGAAGGVDTTLPITVIKSNSGGLLDTVKMSLRNDGAVEKDLIKERTPLAYENIREDDAVYMVRVWRIIDAREKLNLGFRYAAETDNGNQRFISILLAAIKSGDVTAFSSDNDRFTTPITSDDAINAFGGGYDTSKVIDDEGNVSGYQVRPKAVDPDSIYKFELKEDWIFDKETSRLYVRIIGIAPVIPYKLSTGDIVPNSDRPVWWVYYPDLRPVLAKYDVYNPKNMAAQMTWEELFESRMFSSYIVKSTIDNPHDLPLASIYKDNTLFQLLEGDKTKDKIFNYEQSLWSY